MILSACRVVVTLWFAGLVDKHFAGCAVLRQVLRIHGQGSKVTHVESGKWLLTKKLKIPRQSYSGIYITIIITRFFSILCIVRSGIGLVERSFGVPVCLR